MGPTYRSQLHDSDKAWESNGLRTRESLPFRECPLRLSFASLRRLSYQLGQYATVGTEGGRYAESTTIPES